MQPSFFVKDRWWYTVKLLRKPQDFENNTRWQTRMTPKLCLLDGTYLRVQSFHLVHLGRAKVLPRSRVGLRILLLVGNLPSPSRFLSQSAEKRPAPAMQMPLQGAQPKSECAGCGLEGPILQCAKLDGTTVFLRQMLQRLFQ
jgi:hypothetical protein